MSLCGADTLVREMLEAETKRAQEKAVGAVISRPFVIFAAALREIFEESAYERFLNRRSLTSSPQAYREFLRETEDARARRPKCC